MKKVILALMLSMLLGAFGTAYAVTGVADDVPGESIVFPIICEGYQPNNAAGTPVGDPVFGSLNTVWAIAETKNPTCASDYSVCTPRVPSQSGVGVIKANVFVYDKYSIPRWDSSECWSKSDVISDSCQLIINQMDPAARDAMEITIEGVTYFAGYIEYTTAARCTEIYNSLVSWVYFNDIGKGFATGYNGISIENSIGPQLEEFCVDGSCAGRYIGITASNLYPRYYIMNDNVDTWTWWIILAGRNEYSVEAKLDQLGGHSTVPDNNITRKLWCYFCDETEKCQSNVVPIPTELNIINVKPYIPGGVYSASTWPKTGFARCTILETGFFTGQTTSTAISGTISFDDLLDLDTDPETYTLVGWSYQRAKPSISNAYVSVMHPMHRLYCADEGAASELPNRFDPVPGTTVDTCNLVGFSLTDLLPW